MGLVALIVIAAVLGGVAVLFDAIEKSIVNSNPKTPREEQNERVKIQAAFERCTKALVAPLDIIARHYGISREQAARLMASAHDRAFVSAYRTNSFGVFDYYVKEDANNVKKSEKNTVRRQESERFDALLSDELKKEQ